MYNKAVKIIDEKLMPNIRALYGLELYEISRIDGHDGGRNIVYNCEGNGVEGKILRVSYLDDRSKGDFLGELSYVRYLAERGGSVADVIHSKNNHLVEEITHNNHKYYVAMFKKAKGMLLEDNDFCYREGAPIDEYFYNCGKVLGKLHALSKEYTPVHRRHCFFDKYTKAHIDSLVPEELPVLREKMIGLVESMKKLEKNVETYGMIHFDYNDGNYHIDFDNGDITVFDFDNSCFGFYMYDLAELWKCGMGWIESEPDVEKRKAFMASFFGTVIDGYCTETPISDEMLSLLPLFVDATLMEHILDDFVCMRNEGVVYTCDEDLAFRIKCFEENVPFVGFLG